MTDLEISKALALAIGWEIVDSLFYGDAVVVGTSVNWRRFDYRDWNIIGPIAERFDCFPWIDGFGKWNACAPRGTTATDSTPQKAIALAVIGGVK